MDDKIFGAGKGGKQWIEELSQLVGALVPVAGNLGNLENYDEKSVNSFLYTLATTPQFIGDTVGTSWGDMAAKATQEAIIDAAKESCVIVGRNADYILREMPDLFRILSLHRMNSVPRIL